MTIEATFRKNSGYGLGFCLIEVFMLEVALGKDILEGCQVYSKISERGSVS